MSAADLDARIERVAVWLRPGAPDCARPDLARVWFDAVSWFEHAPDAPVPSRAYRRAAALIERCEMAHGTQPAINAHSQKCCAI